jgi:hypothetical protein
MEAVSISFRGRAEAVCFGQDFSSTVSANLGRCALVYDMKSWLLWIWSGCTVFRRGFRDSRDLDPTRLRRIRGVGDHIA